MQDTHAEQCAALYVRARNAAQVLGERGPADCRAAAIEVAAQAGSRLRIALHRAGQETGGAVTEADLPTLPVDEELGLIRGGDVGNEMRESAMERGLGLGEGFRWHGTSFDVLDDKVSEHLQVAEGALEKARGAAPPLDTATADAAAMWLKCAPAYDAVATALGAAVTALQSGRDAGEERQELGVVVAAAQAEVQIERFVALALAVCPLQPHLSHS